MTRIKLILVQAFIDRHGRVRRYFRRRGFKRVPLRGLPGSDEFMKAYRAALSGDPEPIEIGASRTIEETVNALVAAYLDCTDKSSSPFKTFAPETQRTRRNILENFRNQHGDKRIFTLKPMAAASICSESSTRRPPHPSDTAISSIRCTGCSIGL